MFFVLAWSNQKNKALFPQGHGMQKPVLTYNSRMTTIQKGVEKCDHMAITGPRILIELHAEMIRIFYPVDMRQFQVVIIQA